MAAQVTAVLAVAPEVLTASVAPAETVARQALAGPGAAASVLALMVVPVAPAAGYSAHSGYPASPLDALGRPLGLHDQQRQSLYLRGVGIEFAVALIRGSADRC